MKLFSMVICSIRNHPEKVFISGKDTPEIDGCLATYECPKCDHVVNRYFFGKKLSEVIREPNTLEFPH